jgi:hypothetical protein
MLKIISIIQTIYQVLILEFTVAIISQPNNENIIPILLNLLNTNFHIQRENKFDFGLLVV